MHDGVKHCPIIFSHGLHVRFSGWTHVADSLRSRVTTFVCRNESFVSDTLLSILEGPATQNHSRSLWKCFRSFRIPLKTPFISHRFAVPTGLTCDSSPGTPAPLRPMRAPTSSIGQLTNGRGSLSITIDGALGTVPSKFQYIFFPPVCDILVIDRRNGFIIKFLPKRQEFPNLYFFHVAIQISGLTATQSELIYYFRLTGRHQDSASRGVVVNPGKGFTATFRM